MSALRARPILSPSPIIDQADLGLLNTLRIAAMGCRAAPRTDLFEACALLANTTEATKVNYAQALMKCLPLAILKNVTFFRPGIKDITFDEAWLMQALAAKTRGDQDSFRFLIASRIAQPYRRQIAFLVAGIAGRA